MHRTFCLTLTISHMWINFTFDSFNILSLYLVNAVGYFFFKLNLHQHLVTTNISHSWCDVFSLQPHCNNTYHLVSISSCELQEKNHMMTETHGDSLYTLFLHFRGISIFPQNPPLAHPISLQIFSKFKLPNVRYIFSQILWNHLI